MSTGDKLARKAQKKRRKQFRRKVLDPVISVVFYVAMSLCGFCGDLLVKWISCSAAFVWSCLARQTVRIIDANLAVAFPELSAEKRRVIRRDNLRHMVRAGIDFFRVIKRPEKLKALVDYDDIFQNPVVGGSIGENGIQFLGIMAHLGHWELLGLGASACGVPITAITQNFRIPAVDKAIYAARGLHGMETVPVAGGVRGLIRAIRGGRVPAVVMDQNTRVEEGGSFVDFFGLPVTMSRAGITLVKRFALQPHVVALVRRESDGRYELDVESFAKPYTEYSDEELLSEITTAFERQIRRHPEQYVWTYRRWRYIPDTVSSEVADRYPFYARPHNG